MFVPRAIAVSKPNNVPNIARKSSSSLKISTGLPTVDKSSQQKLCSPKNGPTCSSTLLGPGDDSMPVLETVEPFDKGSEIKCDEEEQTVEKSRDQRWPDAGEPICVICNRYGAYICNQTENDVCSLECKQKNIKKKETINEVSAAIEDQTTSHTKRMTPDEFWDFFADNYKFKDHPIIAKLGSQKLEFLRDKFEIKLQGIDLPSVVLEFRHCGFQSKLEENLTANKYLSPTAVQMQAIPVGLSGRDLLACAQTGTGKSASFLLPIIARISATTGTFIAFYGYRMYVSI